MSGKVVTANRLSDGVVVYLEAGGGWTEWIEGARIAHGEADAQAILALAERPEQAVAVVGPYLMDVVGEDGRPRPASPREIIRARGPSVRADLGKQAARIPATEEV
jgi:sulfite reductase (NADPH) hemoprotein beta-component